MKHYLGEFSELVLIAIDGNISSAKEVADLITEISKRPVSNGALYVTFARLEENGFVSSFLGEPTKRVGGRAKRFYKLEEKGKQALIEAERIRKCLKG